MQPMLDADLAPLLELPDPEDDASSIAVVSAYTTVTQSQVMIPRSIPICAASRSVIPIICSSSCIASFSCSVKLPYEFRNASVVLS
jgi:hypothetical protein